MMLAKKGYTKRKFLIFAVNLQFFPLMKTIFLFLVLFWLSGCSHPEGIEYEQEKELRTSRPVSPIGQLADYINRKETARKALKQTELQYEKRQPFVSDSLLQIALKYYDGRGKSQELAKTYFYLGHYYDGLKLMEETVAAFTKAEATLPVGADATLAEEIRERLEQLKLRQNPEIMEDMQWKYRYEMAREETLSSQVKMERWRISSFLLGGCLLVVLSLFRYRWLQRKKELFESQLFIEKLQCAEEDLREKLSRRLNEKDHKLKDFFQQRVEQIKDFVELSRKYGNNYEKLKSKFSTMVSTDSFSSSDWLLLREGVNIRGGGIIDYLEKTYPGLTEENLRYCSLICAGFETDELAILWDVNSDSIYKRRTRLRQKLGLAKTQDLKKFFDELIQNRQME